MPQIEYGSKRGGLESYERLESGLHVRAEALEALLSVEAVVFDVDGVLLDVRHSYPMVIAESVLFYLTKISGMTASDQCWPIRPDEIMLFKQAGGFNDDWAIAKAVVLHFLAKSRRSGRTAIDELRRLSPSLEEFTAEIARRGGGLESAKSVAGLDEALATQWDEALIRQLCEEHYGGDDWCERMFGFVPEYRTGLPGLFNRERAFLDPDLLDGRIDRFGIYTTRVRNEAFPALELAGISRLSGTSMPDGAILTEGSGYSKPDPEGLYRIADVLGVDSALFVGDNIDDWRTVDFYRAQYEDAGAPTFWFAGIEGGALGDDARRIFSERGADLIARDVNAVLRLVQQRS